MSKESENEQLNIEWRQLIVQKLDNLTEKQDLIQADLTYIKLNYATNSTLDAVRADVSDLKLAKTRFIAVTATLNLLVLVVGWMIQTYLLAKH
jgi:hypothetical protein